MVREQIEWRGIEDRRVLTAMLDVPRHLFVPQAYRNEAYGDYPLPLGPEETISQPYIVAYMLEKLDLNEDDRVLEIGTGSGYQTAILCRLVKEVFSVEIDDRLTKSANTLLEKQGYNNFHLLTADGREGWEEFSPFSKIIVSAASPSVPSSLVAQLAEKGKMIIPVGEFFQRLVLVTKERDAFRAEECCGVSFVRLRGSEK